jgi:hypothetical protein
LAQSGDDGRIVIEGSDIDTSSAGERIAGETVSSDNHSADGTIIIEPSTLGGNASGSAASGNSTGKRRGRKPGSRNRSTKSTNAQIDLNGLEFILLSAHEMLAGITKTPELELDGEEGKKLALSIGNVARHYDMTMSAKAMDWTAFFMTIGALYGSRLAAIRMRRMMERKEAVDGTVRNATRPAATARPNTVTSHIPGVGDVEVPLN